MKRLSLVLLLVLSLSGCAGLDAALDIADILLGEDEDVIHSGTVEEVHHGKDSTTIKFDDGVSYQVDDYTSARPGNKAKIIKTETGYKVE
jgi:hypothetical protein